MHGWCDPQRFVDAAEIIIGSIKRHRRAVILEFLAETVSEPRQPTLAHAEGKVLALDVTGRYVLGIAADRCPFHLHKLFLSVVAVFIAVARDNESLLVDNTVDRLNIKSVAHGLL